MARSRRATILALAVLAIRGITPASSAFGGCTEPQPGTTMVDSAQHSADTVVNAIDSQVSDPAEVIQAAQAYMHVVVGPDPDTCTFGITPKPADFDMKAMRDRIAKLRIISSSSAPKRLRSEAYLVDSGLSGIVALKTRSPSDGLAALKALRASLKTDPGNPDAVVAYSKTIIGISMKNWVERQVLKTFADVDLKKEAQEALTDINQVHGPDCIAKALNDVINK